MLDLYTVKACSEVNPAIDEGKLIIVDGKPTFSISDLGVTFTSHDAIQSLLRNGAKKVLSAYTASQKTRINAAIIETIDVWREDKSYLTMGEKEKALKPVAITTSGKPVKAAYGRIEIEGALRDVHGLDDKRVKVVEAFSDEKFKRFMETMKDDAFLTAAITLLNEKALKAAELQAEKDKAEFEALFGSLGG